MKTNLYNYIDAEGLGQSQEGSLVVGSVSVSPCEQRLVVSVCFLVVHLTPLDPTINPSSLSSAGFSEFHPVFDCGSLHLFPSVTG